jgi:hypothetical protein
MIVTRDVVDHDRAYYDAGACLTWASIDTDQDAPYFGIWTHPNARAILTYVEGDTTLQYAVSDAEYSTELRRIVDWHKRNGGTAVIDPCGNHAWIERFAVLGVSDLITS